MTCGCWDGCLESGRNIISETNMSVRGSVKVAKTITEKRLLKWYGHVARRGEEDAQRRMLDASTRRDGKEGRELGERLV